MMKKIKIGNKFIGQNQPVFVIAEAGVNHNGRLDLALKLIDAAADAGADAVKFQTFRAKQVVTGIGQMAAYQKKNLGKEESQLSMLKKLELKEKFYEPIIKRCKEKGMMFLSTPHGGFESVDFLQKLNMIAFKFGSGDLNNLPLLQYAARFNKPMILSTGMATIKEVEEAFLCIKKAGNKKIIVLHCTTNYPCSDNEVNLRAMQTMMKKLDVLVGYSDHTQGMQVPIMAATMGACLVEKHFTLDKTFSGPDHLASANPSELKELFHALRRVDIIMGSAVKKPNKSEIDISKQVRKSIIARYNISAGQIIRQSDLEIKRPGTGMPPAELRHVIGKIARRDIFADTMLTKQDYGEK